MTFSAPLRHVLGRFSLEWQVRLVLGAGVFLVNLLGGALLLVLAGRLMPVPDVPDEAGLRLDNFLMACAAMVLGAVITLLVSRSLMSRLVAFLAEDREPHDAERRAVLRAPARLTLVTAVLWGAGAAVFGIFNGRVDRGFGLMMAVMVGLSGLCAGTVTYLVAERALRPLVRRALASGVPDRVVVPSVAMRSMVAWSLSSGVALLGVAIAGVSALALRDDVTVDQLALTMIVLGTVALLIGGWTNLLAARASSDPVRSLSQAVARVGDGDLASHVDIYDGTEIGLLQAGFNDMVHGLREREQLRDLFGRHVGGEVARAALAGGVLLGGEARHVGVLFVDIIGSTTIATERPPEEVVALLNRFFDVVIDVVHEHEGWINKFEGDAALAVWGAPIAVPDMEEHVLRAARLLGERLHAEVPELSAGIGVSAGTAVAGNVGAAERYEYTVIGDPVNEAARLTGLAKSVPGYVVANAGLLDNAGHEVAHWEEIDPVVVRGRSEPTRCAAPRR